MNLTISIADLSKLDACSEGVQAFREFFGADAYSCDWTRDKQIELLKSPIGRWLGWAHQVGLIPWWNLNGASLTGASLDGANLNRADLNRANLNRADLNGADLNGANLNRADLNRADLTGANLTGADLNGANLNGAYVGDTLYAELFRSFGWEIDENKRLKRIGEATV